ncbi:MAG: hypothetical protein ACK5NB_11195 [Flavobacteriaceae bacterium]
MKKALLFVFAFYLFPFVLTAQCAMCRAVLETEQGQNTAEGINDGIVYLMAIPYILIGGIAYFIYRKFKALKK